MRLRRRLIAPALLALAAMLYLQAAIGFAACDLPEPAADMQPGCHEPAHDRAPCLAHCSAQDPTVAKAQLAVPDLAAHPVAPVRVAAIDLPPAAPLRTTAVPAAGPPARIRFQSFLL